MGQPTVDISPDVLKRAADRLGEVSQKLMDAYDLLHVAGLDLAAMPWTNAHRKAIDKLVFVSGMLEGAAKVAIDAAKEDRKSDVEERRERNRRDYMNRIAKTKAETGKAPATSGTQKKRGRPPTTPS